MICLKCKIDKPEGEFAWRLKKAGFRQVACRSCMALYHQKSYPLWKIKRDPEIERERQRIKIRRAREFVFQYKKAHPCIDCQEADPVVLGFDHLDKSEPFSIYTRINKFVARGYSIGRIKNEIKKCVLRCANCHRKKTAKEQGWYKSLERQV